MTRGGSICDGNSSSVHCSFLARLSPPSRCQILTRGSGISSGLVVVDVCGDGAPWPLELSSSSSNDGCRGSSLDRAAWWLLAGAVPANVRVASKQLLRSKTIALQKVAGHWPSAPCSFHRVFGFN